MGWIICTTRLFNEPEWWGCCNCGCTSLHGCTKCLAFAVFSFVLISCVPNTLSCYIPMFFPFLYFAGMHISLSFVFFPFLCFIYLRSKQALKLEGESFAALWAMSFRCHVLQRRTKIWAPLLIIQSSCKNGSKLLGVSCIVYIVPHSANPNAATAWQHAAPVHGHITIIFPL
jgi:hypothetical protein